MQIQRRSFLIFRYILDINGLILSFVFSVYMSSLHAPFEIRYRIGVILILFIVVWIFSSQLLGIYDEFRGKNFAFEIIAVLKSVVYQMIAAVLLLFIIKDTSLSRVFVVNYTFLAIILLSLNRYILRKILILFRKRGRNLRSLLIIGAGNVGRSFYNAIYNNPHFGYNIIGFLDDEEKKILNGKYLGPISSLRQILSEEQVDEVIIALPNYAAEKLEEVITICEQQTTRVKIIPDYFRFVSSKYSVSMFGHFPIISVRDDRLNLYYWRLIKRAFDFTFTLCLFILFFSWLTPLIAFVIKTNSKGKVLFKQKRWGRNNKEFITYKFRTMINESKDIDDKGKYQQAKKDDPRITSFGKFLRKTNLDEIPQFWNVLKGEMSIVGPRPHPIPLNMESKDNIRNYMLRHLVKPGITGWAQIQGFRGGTDTKGNMQQRIDHDLWYIENWSFWLDIQIVIMTVWNMIKGDPKAY